MRGPGEQKSWVRTVSGGAALALALAGDVAAGAPARSTAPRSNVRVADEEAADAVRRAVVGAAGRLADARCQQVLTAFRDASGRTLQERLEASGERPEGYLSQLFFYSGDHLAACGGSSEVFAVTMPGSRVVFICLAPFRRRQRQAPVYAEVIIIHEALHSLGLGEDPPSSEEITYRVQASCAH